MQQAIPSPFAQVPDAPLAGRTVLQIIPSLHVGGAERITLDIAEALVAAGARALVATSGGRLVSELQARGGLWVPFPADSRNPLHMLRNVSALAEVIRREGPAVVHAQSRAPAWVALGATRLTGTPLVTTYHGSYAGRHAMTLHYNSVMARGDAVLANSHFTGEAVASLYPWARDRVRVIWPGIDLRAFEPGVVDAPRVDALRQAWGVEPDQRIVLVPARIAPWKGQAVLVEAAALLRERGLSDTRFVLAGEPVGRAGAELDALAARRAVADLVARVGHCDDMPAAYGAASVVAIPSTRPEPFGLGAVEAQAMGKPVVVSNLGANPETVLAPPDVMDGERTAWVVPPGDPEALAAALAAALALGASALDTLALRARAHVERHFTKDHMTEAVLDAYAAVIGGRAAPSMPHAA